MSQKHKIMSCTGLDLLPDTLIFNISSFLLPRDLCRFRYLSSYYKSCISNFLLKNYKTIELLDIICPKCGNDWINTENDLHGFNDIDEDDYFDIIERKNNLSQMNLNETSQKHLLCYDCENQWADTLSISSFKLARMCNYQVYTDFYNTRMPWACLVKIKNGERIWNQYNVLCIPPIIYYFTEDEFDDEFELDHGENSDDNIEEEDYYNNEYKEDYDSY